MLQKWADDQEVRLSWKLDGLTLVLTYDSGKLSKVLTRGNGLIGKNITYLSGVIRGIPETIPCKGHVVVRGEATISYPDFEEINLSLPDGTEPYANPRNLAAGTLNLDDPEEVRTRRVSFTAFTLVKGPDDKPLRNWGDRMQWLIGQGFSVVEYSFVYYADDLQDMIDLWTKRAASGQIETPVDGLVLVYEDTEYAKTLTVTGHHDNGAGMAFKWQDVTAETRLDHIEWSCGATCITPVAVFYPVELEGTTVSRASLHNITQMKKLGIGADGETTLEVFKANMIIPQVASADAHRTMFSIPGKCPVCGYPAEVEGDGINAPEVLHCTNPECAAKNLKKFARFVSKDGLDIDGLSEKKLADLVSGGYMHAVTDLLFMPTLYRRCGEITDFNGENPLQGREGWGESSVLNLVEAIEKAVSDVDMEHFLYAFSIPMCGHDVSRKLLSVWDAGALAARIHNLGKGWDQQCFFMEMQAIDGIGRAKADAFVSWFRDEKNFELFQDVLRMVHIRKENKETAEETCTGLTFVITGSVHFFKNRTEFKAYVEAHGGKVAGSVSKNTDYLVSNEPGTSSKSVKAEKLGIPVITEDEFIAKF